MSLLPAVVAYHLGKPPIPFYGLLGFHSLGLLSLLAHTSACTDLLLLLVLFTQLKEGNISLFVLTCRDMLGHWSL